MLNQTHEDLPVSIFFSDGYSDALAGNEPSPPDEGIYGQEYMEGFREGGLSQACSATENEGTL